MTIARDKQLRLRYKVSGDAYDRKEDLDGQKNILRFDNCRGGIDRLGRSRKVLWQLRASELTGWRRCRDLQQQVR